MCGRVPAHARVRRRHFVDSSERLCVIAESEGHKTVWLISRKPKGKKLSRSAGAKIWDYPEERVLLLSHGGMAC